VSEVAARAVQPENPAAFPYESEHNNGQAYTHHGMSLRDYFAAHAPPSVTCMSGCSAGEIPVMAYDYADDMLAVRLRARPSVPISQAVNQRLLKALESLVEFHEDDQHPIVLEAHAAIVEATGGPA
jgi:hypothetical protein